MIISGISANESQIMGPKCISSTFFSFFFFFMNYQKG
jgi:hypothetical protein